MGSIISSSFEQNLIKTQEFSRDMQTLTLERQIQLQFQIQNRQMAMQIARSRDMCHWYSAFYFTAATGLFSGYRKTKKAYLLAPLVPLTFVALYQWDLAYGNKIQRIIRGAEHIMTQEADNLEWPCGMPSLSSIDLANEEKRKMQPLLQQD